MNILYLNHYAGSPALGMEYRPYYLAREWVRAGHRVQMVAADHSHVRTRQPRAGDELIDGIVYHWVATPPYRGNGPQRARNIAVFLSRVWRDTPRLLQRFRPDVVIASSTYPMDIWVARRLARHSGARLVYEVHDLWPLTPRELFGMSRWHPFILLCQAAEDSAYRDADVVVSMLPKVHAHMAARGLDLRKLSSVADYFVIATGTSEPHLRAIVDEIEEKIHEETGQSPRARDGTVRTNWVVLDYFDVVVHVMRADAREFYDLDSLWGDAPRVRARQTATAATPRKRVKKAAAGE